MTSQYSAEELAAFGAVGLDAEGPPQYARGDWWPDELERRAARAAASVPMLRLAAAAMRREIARAGELRHSSATKPAAQLLREVAAADPEAHNESLGRAYGVDRDERYYPLAGAAPAEEQR